jgi:hypothetical protein
MLQTFAASLRRSLSPTACALRQVHSRYNEAEFPPASQSAWNEFDSALDESRAMDGVPTLFGALRPFDNWKTGKDQHELLFIGKTATPPARRRPTEKKTFWQRVAEFFGNGGEKKKAPAQPRNGTQPTSRPARKPERVEVTSPRLYVGNLSFDATESDLFDLFNGVGHVQNAEVVSYRHNQRSKGFAFVQMQTVEEAKRAVEELHDKEFLGRRLVVSGAKSDQHQPH